MRCKIYNGAVEVAEERKRKSSNPLGIGFNVSRTQSSSSSINGFQYPYKRDIGCIAWSTHC